jgi:hypothetical protein
MAARGDELGLLELLPDRRAWIGQDEEASRLPSPHLVRAPGQRFDPAGELLAGTLRCLDGFLGVEALWLPLDPGIVNSIRPTPRISPFSFGAVDAADYERLRPDYPRRGTRLGIGDWLRLSGLDDARSRRGPRDPVQRHHR